MLLRPSAVKRECHDALEAVVAKALAACIGRPPIKVPHELRRQSKRADRRRHLHG